MNNTNLIGYIATEPKQSGDAATFLLAVRRTYESKDGETADFINCIGWGGLATNIMKHLHKGSHIGLSGSIKTSHYTDAGGSNRLGWQVVAEKITFLDPKPKPRAKFTNSKPDFSAYIKTPTYVPEQTEAMQDTTDTELSPELEEMIAKMQKFSKKQAKNNIHA
ncbi:single-stranded DNA-binding protein [Lacticaseibacillus parakribbianus]|uniref:single-stranded DNA-binding protein n=1 Tax=Lacticaseibacillus parakribbianus TaxID=2970927 RepID=UPI0021CB41DD|nr:single-stranded DNA-binding protein [Lacticaseibacillus parakribbianus]